MKIDHQANRRTSLNVMTRSCSFGLISNSDGLPIPITHLDVLGLRLIFDIIKYIVQHTSNSNLHAIITTSNLVAVTL